MGEYGRRSCGDKDLIPRPAAAGGEVGRSSPARMVVLIVSLTPEDAGRRDRLKLLEEPLSLDLLRRGATTELCEKPEVGLDSGLAFDATAAVVTGIFLF